MGMAWVDFWWCRGGLDGYSCRAVGYGVVVGTKEGHIEGVGLLYMVELGGGGAGTLLVRGLWLVGRI